MKRWSEKRLHRMAAERERIALAWDKVNEGAGASMDRLAFIYSLTPPAKVPQMVQDQAARMLNYCRKALGLGPVSIVWIEWELKRRSSRAILTIRTKAICGLAASRGEGRRSWSWPGSEAHTNQPLMCKLQQDTQGDLVIVRWDLPMREFLLTVAHEARHLWHAAQGCRLPPVEEDAECEAFAFQALKNISGGRTCNR